MWVHASLAGERETYLTPTPRPNLKLTTYNLQLLYSAQERYNVQPTTYNSLLQRLENLQPTTYNSFSASGKLTTYNLQRITPLQRLENLQPTTYNSFTASGKRTTYNLQLLYSAQETYNVQPKKTYNSFTASRKLTTYNLQRTTPLQRPGNVQRTTYNVKLLPITFYKNNSATI